LRADVSLADAFVEKREKDDRRNLLDQNLAPETSPSRKPSIFVSIRSFTRSKKKYGRR